jgi:hypothetical protein
MTRLARLIPAALLVTGFTACTDKTDATAPVQSRAVPTALAASVATTSAAVQSSTCVTYGQRRDALQARLAAEPSNEDLQESVAQYNAVIAANCK